MKKTLSRKLVLERQTIRELTPARLRGVAGGNAGGSPDDDDTTHDLTPMLSKLVCPR